MKNIITILAVLIGFHLVAQPAGWLYSQPITVTNPNAQSSVDYQLKITVNTQSLITANQMSATGNDIRFGGTCTGNTFFNYWIEGGINTPTTNIWVKIPYLAANSSTVIFMFFGNPAAPAVSAIQGTFRGPSSSTDSVSGGTSGGLTVCQRGFRFSPNQNILVTSFGKNEPTGSTRYVTLFNYSTQAILSQTQVAGPAGSYTYCPIQSPLWLTAGTQYVLQIYGLATDGYYYGSSSQINPHLTYYEMQYSNGGTQNTFPNSTLANYHYGYGDLLFYITNTLTTVPSYSLGGSASSVGITGPNVLCSGNSATLTTTATGSFTWSTGSTASVIVVSPTVTTTYTIAGAGGLGCIPSLTININNAVPSLSIANSATSTICPNRTVTLTASGANTYTWTGGITNAASFAATVSSGYTVTGQNGCGTSTAATAVTVNPLPNVTASINNPTVCSGGSVTLNGGGALSYTWSGGISNNVSFVPSATSSYTVTGTDANSCTATAVTAVTVFVTPNIPPAISPTAICSGASATISATGATGYTWTPGSALNSPSVVVSPNQTTTYTLARTNGACPSTATIALVVNPIPIFNASGGGTICAGQPVALTAVGAISYTWLPGGFTQSTFTIYPNFSTNYVITASNGPCTATASVPVVVNPSPTISVVSTPTICSGATAQMSASGATSYTWLPVNIYTSATSVTPLATSLYTVIGGNSFGCTSSLNPLVVVYATPNTTLSTSSNYVCVGQPAVISASNTPNVTYSWNTGANTYSISVSPTVTTGYTLTGTDPSSGCQSSNTISLAVYIATFAVSSPSAVCKGSTVTITASGSANSYTWSSNANNATTASVSVSPSITTVYSVTGLTGNCSSVENVTLVVNPVPNVIATRTKPTVCVYDPNTSLVASGANTYSWSTGDVTATVVISPTVTTTYTLTGTDLNGCSKTLTVTQFVAACTGIENYSQDEIHLNIYPNPNNGSFVINTDVTMDVNIVNTVGQVVGKARIMQGSANNVNVSNLSNGIYFITGQANGLKVNKKIIVEK